MAGGSKGGQGGRGNKAGSHRKGAARGSGGQKRRALAGKGPTPRAENRVGHPAKRRADAKSRNASSRGGGRGTAESEVVVGRNAVVESLRAGAPATTLYVAERVEMDQRVREAVQHAGDTGLAVLEVPRPELDRITSGAPHQGLALQVPPYDYAHPEDLPRRATDAGEVPLVVALDGVTDPRNLGAVVRSAGAFGGHGVVVPERRAAGMTAAAWKTSAGAAARVPVARATNLSRALTAYKGAGLMVVGLAGEAETTVEDLELATEPLVLVAGAEGRGLSRLVGQTCDLLVRIPIAGTVESLNASVASGIALHEVARVRGLR
jgi:23S rRNA (guanosine2251-2'-O)-methyltransferase